MVALDCISELPPADWVMLLPAYGSLSEQNSVTVLASLVVSTTFTMVLGRVLDTASEMIGSRPVSSMMSEQGPSTDTVLPSAYSSVPAS